MYLDFIFATLLYFRFVLPGGEKMKKKNVKSKMLSYLYSYLVSVENSLIGSIGRDDHCILGV